MPQPRSTPAIEINRSLSELVPPAIQQAFPITSNDGAWEVEVDQIEVDSKRFDPFDLNAHQRARQSGGTRAVPVTGRATLRHKGKTVSSRKVKLGSLPLMNKHGSFTVGGNDYYVPLAQTRLKAGAYTRQKLNGEYSTTIPTQVGRLSVWMDPARGILKLGHGSTNVSFYGILAALGVTDDQFVRAWGGDERAHELLQKIKLR